MTEVNLYAEFLLNIRQVTIYASLEDAITTNSKALIKSDKKSLTVEYEGTSSTITFPSGISGTATAELPVEGRRLISLRLEITEDNKPSHSIEVDNDTPWPASSLSQETRIACRSCRHVVVDSAARQWKDLPREYWAELMDLWHCHKPAAPHPNGSQTSSKGYAADNKPRLRQGLAFVDMSYLLFPEPESGGTKIVDDDVLCASCETLLGSTDSEFEGLRLNKWSILVQRHQTSSWEQNDVQYFVCAQLLALIESQATKKFAVHSKDPDSKDTALLLWVLNPDLKFSASYLNDGRPRRAMKVLSQDIDDPIATLNDNPNVEELVLPHAVFKELKKDLDESNQILPNSAKTLQGWRVSLLERFDPTGE